MKVCSKGHMSRCISNLMLFVRVQEEIRDLLSKDQKKRLELKERPDTGVYVKVHLLYSCEHG